MEGQPDKTIAIGLSARDGRAAVAIADNGPGVDPSVADKLFDSFVTTKPMGMGVGLAICRDIAESHGGGLVQSSNTPRGAVFTFWLPLLDEGGQPEAA
jgi:two-component system sensor kinase FixL